MSRQAWGAPLERLDQLWVRVETRLAVWVIVTEIIALCAWVALKSLASTYTPGGNVIGLIFRTVGGAALFAVAAHFALRGKQGAPPKRGYRPAIPAALLIGAVAGWVLVAVGVDYFANVVSWLQNASSLALIGGPRGLVTRLTLWLALLGGSLAASTGKHINIDVATRYLPARLTLPVAVLGWSVAAAVCFAASYGFVDSIAVTKFRAEAFHACPEGQEGSSGICDTGFGQRVAKAREGMGEDLFLLGRQLSLDLRTVPRVLAGRPYDRYLSAAEWNAWVRDADWRAHFSREEVDSLLMPTDDPAATKMPMVTAPDTGEGRDLLIRDLNFVLPFGLLVIGLKMLLRVLRVLSGQVRFEPDAAHAPEGAEVRS